MRLRESRRAALVALVGSGWGNERHWVARVYIIPAELVLSFEVRQLWLSLGRSLSLRLSLTPSLSLSISLSLDLSSSLSLRLSLSPIMIMKETERAKEKKEKQNKKQKKNVKRRNERKNIEVDSPKVASEMPWRCHLLSFLKILLPNRQVPKGVGTEMRALVASWGLLLRDEGAWSAVEVCRGLLGGHIGGSRVPKEKV